MALCRFEAFRRPSSTRKGRCSPCAFSKEVPSLMSISAATACSPWGPRLNTHGGDEKVPLAVQSTTREQKPSPRSVLNPLAASSGRSNGDPSRKETLSPCVSADRNDTCGVFGNCRGFVIHKKPSLHSNRVEKKRGEKILTRYAPFSPPRRKITQHP
jgi:hypothetical protein